MKQNIDRYILRFMILIYFFIFSIVKVLFSIYGLWFGNPVEKSNFWSLITNIVGYNLGIVTSLVTNNKDKISKKIKGIIKVSTIN